MGAHLTRWQRLQITFMAYGLWATAGLALIATGYFTATLITEHRTH